MTNTDNLNLNFESKRNDPLINKYSKYMMLAWRANTDISPILNIYAI